MPRRRRRVVRVKGAARREDVRRLRVRRLRRGGVRAAGRRRRERRVRVVGVHRVDRLEDVPAAVRVVRRRRLLRGRLLHAEVCALVVRPERVHDRGRRRRGDFPGRRGREEGVVRDREVVRGRAVRSAHREALGRDVLTVRVVAEGEPVGLERARYVDDIRHDATCRVRGCVCARAPSDVWTDARARRGSNISNAVANKMENWRRHQRTARTFKYATFRPSGRKIP
eukprot:31278-Pelagococcus_subviridis.AAC.2